MPLQVCLDTLGDGYVAFRGACDLGDKLAVITTKHNKGLAKNGVTVMEDIPRAEWQIHWTSPSFPLGLIEAVLAALPKS